MTTIDHAGALAASRPDTLSDEHVAGRALQVARRTALGVLGDAEAAADIAQDVAITAVRRAGSLRDPAALDAWLHRIAVRAALREARRAGRRRAAERAGHDPPPPAPDDEPRGEPRAPRRPARAPARGPDPALRPRPPRRGDRPRPALPDGHRALAALTRARGRARRHRRRPEPPCRTADPDLHETFAPLREVEPTPEEIARVLALADELRSPRSLAAPAPARRRAPSRSSRPPPRVIGAHRGAARRRRLEPSQDAHGIFQAAAAVAAEQPAPAAYRYTRALDRFVYGVNAADGQRGRVTEQQTSENWTSDGWRGTDHRRARHRHVARRRAPRCWRRRGDIGAVVKPYDGDYRYGDGPLARVPFAAIPRDAAAAGALLEAAIRDGRWVPDPTRTRTGRPASSSPRSPAARSCCSRWATSTAASARRCSGCSAARPGARSLGEVTDATGRKGVGVALRLPDLGAELRVIIDPETSDILQSSEVMAPPPAQPRRRRRPARPRPPWPPPAWLAERTQVFLSTGSVAALGERP